MGQPSNRDALLDAAARCLAQLPIDRISARVIAAESGANLASIGYHFESKDGLVTEAIVRELDRWLEAMAAQLESAESAGPSADPIGAAAAALDRTFGDHTTTARAFVVAMARALHDEAVAARLIEGFRHTRPRVAQLLGLGDDDTGIDAGGLIHAMFVGLLVQSLLSEDLHLDAHRVVAALTRIAATRA